MKKLFYVMIAALFVMPLFVTAKVNNLDVVTNDKVTTGEDGNFHKTYKINAVTSSNNEEVTEVVVKISAAKGSTASNFVCSGTLPFKVTTTNDKGTTVCTFKVDEGVAGAKADNKKVELGEVDFMVPSGADNCNIEVTLVTSDGSVSTGASLNITLISIGVVGIAAIYFVSKSRRKMFSI